MTKRLEILKSSLAKKEKALEGRFDTHFADVKRANGQPINDKRNGPATFKRWEKQSDSIRNAKDGVEKTERAITREQDKIMASESALGVMPKPIVALVEAGVLTQWRKHPTTFFVNGVDKARVQWKKGKLVYRYLSSIKCKDQYAIFRDVVNGLNKELAKLNAA